MCNIMNKANRLQTAKEGRVETAKSFAESTNAYVIDIHTCEVQRVVGGGGGGNRMLKHFQAGTVYTLVPKG